MIYTIIAEWGEACSLACSSLEIEVNEHISKGYEPIGGVSVVYNSELDSYHATQAMIKKI